MKKEKRLTQWVADGASLILDNPTTAEEARQQVMVQFKKACTKLAELEDKIESGQLVELPYAPDRIDVGLTQTVQSIRDGSVELRTPIYIALQKDTLEEASAMLKELERNAAELDDSADAIVYGLRSITNALKADNNPDER